MNSTRTPPLTKQYGLPHLLDPATPFTTVMALDAGLTADRLAALCAAGRVVRLFKGVYRPGSAVDSQRLRLQALALVVGPEYVVCDYSAAWVWRVDILPPGSHEDEPPVAMFRSRPGRLRNAFAASGERAMLSRDVTVRDGVRLTVPLRTACDCGRLLHRDRGFAALDALLGLGEFTRQELIFEVERFKGMRGVRQLRALAPLADGRAESPPESILRLRALDLGNRLPRMEPQVWVADDDGVLVHRLDLANEEHKLAFEYDGEEFHTTPEQRERDRRRRQWLRARGWVIVVFRREDLFGRLAYPEARMLAAYREALAR